jgi:serine phosphatase RsbU (regulator of sigma subunit)/putative methionine-R-sulfoxide reductase with GAF domain
MQKKPQEAETLWRQFLSLGEDLLNQTNTLSIMEHLVDRISQQFSCNAQLYLVEPAYPLPGEGPLATIPSASAPELVFQVNKNKKLQQNYTKDGTHLPVEVAIPLITQDTLLAVLHVSRPISQPFTKQDLDLLEGITSYAAVAMQVNRQITLKNWRFEQISLVRSVSAQITNVVDLDKLCHQITSLIQSSFNYYFVSIFTIEEGIAELRFRASASENLEPIQSAQINGKIGEGMIGYSALTGKERVAKDVKQDEYFKIIESLPETRAEACLPLMVDGRILGVLDIQSRKVESFHENDMMVLRSLADNIALAVEGARLYDRLQKRADQLNAVLEINYSLSSILDVDKLLEEIVHRIHDRFNYPFVHIFTVHPGRRKVIYQTGSGIRSKHLRSNSFAYDLDAGKGLIPLVARTGKPILSNDVSQEPNYIPSKLPPHNTRSELTIPLIFGKDVLGVLDLQSDQINSFNSEDLELFEGLAAGIAVSLRNANLFRTEKWRRQVADSFQDVASLLSANTELPELLDHILVELEKTLPCDASAIWLLKNETNTTTKRSLQLAAAHGVSQIKLIKILDENPPVRLFLDHSLESSNPTIRRPGGPYGPLGMACGFPNDYSSISVPLRAGDNVLGTLTLAHHLDGRYGSEASTISATFANYAAVAIQNARLFSSAQEEAWSSTVLLQVTEASQTIAGEDELLSTMNRLIPLLVGIDKCAIYLFDEEKNLFSMKSWYGFHPTAGEQSISEIDSLPFLKLVTLREPVYILDAEIEPDFLSLKELDNLSTLVLLPIIAHGQVLGALLVSHLPDEESRLQSRFREHTITILQGITQQTAVALENIRLVETRQEEAYITAVLLQVAQAVVSQNDLNDILDSIIHLMPILVGTETCAIYLWDRQAEKFVPRQAITQNRSIKDWLGSTSFRSGDFYLLDEVKKSLSISVGKLPFAMDLPEKWIHLPSTNFQENQINIEKNKGHWLLGFPLTIKSEFYGVLVTCENETPSTYPQKRIELLTGVAQQISLAIQDDRLKQEMISRERMEQEIQLARQIQKTFLPERLPKIKGWNLDLRWNTAREVGGDFYDVFAAHDHKFAFSIADVADKGMPAALYMTVTRTLIHSAAQTLHSPAEVLKQVNQQLMMDTQNGMFITAVFGFLEPASGKLEFAIAGHNLPLIYRSGSQQIERLPKDGMALGVLAEANYTDQETNLREGDFFLLYTDGVTETFSPEGEIFGEKRLSEELQDACIHHPENVLETLQDKLSSFRGSNILSDDVTMVSFQRKK